MRKLAGDDPEVNEEWLCDKGRFAFRYAQASDRIRRPLIRNQQTGILEESSWTEALRVAATGLSVARDGQGVGVLTGGRVTVEDAYAYSKFARIALGTNDIDFRARAHSAEELDFLSSQVVFSTPENGVTFAAIESAPTVFCVAFESEEEAPIVFLRLRKASLTGKTKIFHLGQWTTSSVRKSNAQLLACVPGAEATAVDAIEQHAEDLDEALRAEGAVVLVGERAAEIPGLFSALTRLSQRTGAKLAWIPRRAGERGALTAGALPTLLPGGIPVAGDAGRAQVESLWGLEPGSLPSKPGRDTTGILAAAAKGELGGLLVGGVDPNDLPDPELALAALTKASFVVSLELRPSLVTERADVVLPIAPSVEKAGSYLNWEGRHRQFDATLENTGSLSDCRVLDTLAVEMDVDLFTQTPGAAAGDLARLLSAPAVSWAYVAQSENEPDVTLEPSKEPDVTLGSQKTPESGNAVLATWRQLLDDGSLQVDEPHLAGTARPAVARVSATTAKGRRWAKVSTDRGSITLPVEVADLPDDVVWLPGNSEESHVRAILAAGHGSSVSLSMVSHGGVE